MQNVKKVIFDEYMDKYGHLTPIEERKDVPFAIKRIYYIYKVEEAVRRGFHAHRKLEQVLICVSGSVKISVRLPNEEKIYELNNPKEGLYVGHMVWREMFEFSNDAVLLVLASEYYDDSDYIRDYGNYEEIARSYFV